MLNFIENINSTTINKNIIDYGKVDVKMTDIMDLKNNYCARIAQVESETLRVYLSKCDKMFISFSGSNRQLNLIYIKCIFGSNTTQQRNEDIMFIIYK